MKRIIIFVAFCLVCFSTRNAYTDDKVTQETKGNQSPAVQVAPGGSATFNYVVPNQAANIDPEIQSKLEYVFKVEKGEVRKQIDNPEIIITSMGPIKAVSLSVDFKSYGYDVNLAEITHFAEFKKEPHGHLIFLKELQPTDHVKQQLNGLHGKDIVAIYVFNLKYYREPDMKMYNRQDIYFIENYKIFSEGDYSKNNNYAKIIDAIKSNKLPSNGQALCLRGLDEHVWFAEETSKTGIYLLEDDGRALHMSGAQSDPRELIIKYGLNEARPVLFVRPALLKKTGTYLNPSILNDNMVNIEMAYEVENIGDIEAINISEIDGTTYNKPLKPGEKIYLKPGVTLAKRSGEKETPQDLLNYIDKQDFFIEHGDTILYSQELGNKKYVTKVVYKIGQKKIELIKYEMK